MTKIQEETQRAMNTSANVMTEMTQQNIAQLRAVIEGTLLLADKMVNQPASAVQEHSMALAHETMRNVFDFGSKMAVIKDPQQWMLAHNEFLTTQSQTFAEHTKQLSERLVQNSGETANTAVREARKRFEAA